ncbi:MAG: GAP family protein, partial [Streptosporangiaceae bacterium]
VSWLKIVLGILLLLVAVRQFRGRPHDQEQAAMPKWMGAIDNFKPPAALGTGALLAGANPKNLLLAVGGAVAIAQTGIDGAQQAIAYLIFAVIATIGIGAPVGIYFALGKRSQDILGRLKDWMGQHNAVIMSVLCLIIGAKLIGDAISALT